MRLPSVAIQGTLDSMRGLMLDQTLKAAQPLSKITEHLSTKVAPITLELNHATLELNSPRVLQYFLRDLVSENFASLMQPNQMILNHQFQYHTFLHISHRVSLCTQCPRQTSSETSKEIVPFGRF
jgi:predicted choloylglycine hydrolase